MKNINMPSCCFWLAVGVIGTSVLLFDESEKVQQEVDNVMGVSEDVSREDVNVIQAFFQRIISDAMANE